MDALLRWYVQWRGRSRAAQVIVLDGGAEVEKARHFLRGALFGIGSSFFVVVLAAPNTADPELLAEADRRAAMLHDARQKAAEAAKIAGLCLNTAQHMEWTLDEYRRALARR